MKAMKINFASQNNSRNAKTNLYFLLFITLVIFGSCKNNDDNDVFEEVLSGDELEQSILDKRQEEVQNFMVDASVGGEIYGEEGTIITFGPNAFLDQNQDPVSGDVDIELIEIYDKGKMLLTKMPTNGKRPNGDIETLKSGGEFYINATQNGNQLDLANGLLLFAPSDDIDYEMGLFDGRDDDCDGADLECDIVWEEQDNQNIEPIQREGPDGAGVTGYGGFVNNFGWTNIDRWYNDPRPKTMLQVDVPEGYDNTNCNVYVSYVGENSLALLDIYDPDAELFSEHYGLIPVGLEVHIIFVSVQDDEYVYAIQSTTIEENHLEIIETTNTGTEEELVALINALP